MSRNLFDFGNENVQENNKKLDVKEEAKELFDKYKNLSQNELLNEFLLTSRENLKNGTLTKEKLNNTIQILKPFLTEEQNEFVKGIVKKIDE